MNAASSVPTRSPRLHSLDALRGLDMLIILGLDALILLLASRKLRWIHVFLVRKLDIF